MFDDLVQYFKGSWQFEREIIFSGSGLPYATATGTAVFAPSSSNGHELIYKEQGTVIICGESRQSSFFRHYRYLFHANGVDVFFQDELTQNFGLYQHYFFDSKDQRLVAGEQHLCNKDVYEGSYLLEDPGHFLLTTLIKGPAKDHLITTRFHKTELAR